MKLFELRKSLSAERERKLSFQSFILEIRTMITLKAEEQKRNTHE